MDAIGLEAVSDFAGNNDAMDRISLMGSGCESAGSRVRNRR